MYRFQALQDVGLQQIADCFNSAFSDYEQPIHFTAESFRYYITASAVDLSLSFGAFCGEQLVGLILNSGGIYAGEQVVYDAGTGVVPEHRGNKVFSGLFAYTVEQLQQRGITNYCLEVLQANHHAIDIYSKNGFSVRREFSVLSAPGNRGKCEYPVCRIPYGEFEVFPTKCSVAPSFEHTSHTIDRNPQLYEVVYLKGRAYCVFAKRNGMLIQLHYNESDDLKAVISCLLSNFPSVFAKNIDFRYGDVLALLASLGFKEVTRQYEMTRKIP